MKLRPFELALVVIFIALAMIALFLLATAKVRVVGPVGTVNFGTVSIWGTLPQEAVDKVLAKAAETNEYYGNVSYRYFAPEEFEFNLLKALADGRGPDLVLTSHEKLVEMRGWIQPVSYESFPIRDIRNNYIDGAEIFALSDGLYGYPVAVDPIVMYWNRDILASAGYLDAPVTWEALINTMFPNLIIRDFDRTIRRSVLAFGEFGNVRNSFGVLSTLLLQGGTKGVYEGGVNDYNIALHSASDGANPLRISVDFYTRFSKPSNSLYSWNRSLPEDRNMFISEDLAFYFGYGSEGRVIEKINPNLNFDIAEVPQGAASTIRRTYGKFYAVSLLKSSDNKNGAARVMLDLGGAGWSEVIANNSNMAPVYTALVTAGSNDTYGRIYYKSAGIAYGWLNPDVARSKQIFETMARDINENRRSASEAADDAIGRLSAEY